MDDLLEKEKEESSMAEPSRLPDVGDLPPLPEDFLNPEMIEDVEWSKNLFKIPVDSFPEEVGPHPYLEFVGKYDLPLTFFGCKFLCKSSYLLHWQVVSLDWKSIRLSLGLLIPILKTT